MILKVFLSVLAFTAFTSFAFADDDGDSLSAGVLKGATNTTYSEPDPTCLKYLAPTPLEPAQKAAALKEEAIKNGGNGVTQ